MPFPFYNAGSSMNGTVREIENVSTGRFLSTAFDYGARESIVGSLKRISEFDNAATGRLLTKAEANKLYGMDGLSFEQDVYEGQAELMRERKLVERRTQVILGAGRTSLMRTLGMFGASMAGSMSNPYDIAVGFIPIVGPPAKAGVAAKGARAGLISFEAVSKIPVVGRFPNTAAAVIEGSIGQAIAEIPTAIANLQDGSDYGAEDALINIGGAGLLSGSLRAALSGAARALSRVSEATHREIMKAQEAQVIQGRPMDATAVIKSDANLHRFQTELEERMAKRGLLTQEQRANLETETLARVDAEVESRRKTLVASDPARHINEKDLIELARAEIRAAEDAGYKPQKIDEGFGAYPDIDDLARAYNRAGQAIAEYDRAKGSRFSASKKKGKKTNEKLREVEARMRGALDDLADVFDLSFRPEAKDLPKIFTSLSDRKKFDFTVAKHLPETVRQGLSQANRAEVIRRMGDNQLEARLARGKIRKSQEALKLLDEQFRAQDQEIAKLSKQLEDDFALTEREQKFADLDQGDAESTLKAIEEDKAEMVALIDASGDQRMKSALDEIRADVEKVNAKLKAAEAAANCIEING